MLRTIATVNHYLGVERGRGLGGREKGGGLWEEGNGRLL